jgi:hypothetical protein
MFHAKILADSIGPTGVRITTAELTFPRSILAEYNTHAMIRRNAASSRAIPTSTLIKKIEMGPFVPEFRQNQKGMQAGEVIEDEQKAKELWLESLNSQIDYVKRFQDLNCHKQYVNRLIEAWMWVTIITTATDWNNMFYLRTEQSTEPSYQIIAKKFWDIYSTATPKELDFGQWHIPLVFEEDKDLDLETQLKVSAARCGRVSYLTHEGKRDIQADLDLFNKLTSSGHWSPTEHVATPATYEDMTYSLDQLKVINFYRHEETETKIVPKTGEFGYCGPFKEWKSLRKCYKNENITEFNGY